MKKNKKALSLLLAAVLALAALLSGCGDGKTETSAPASSAPESAVSSVPASEPASEPEVDPNGTHMVTDSTGHEAEIPNTVGSIVVPFPAATQTVLGLGAGDLLTGCYILKTDMNAIMFSKYNETTTLIKPNEINAEVVLNCKPSFAILASSGQADAISGTDVPYLLYSGSGIDAMKFNAKMIAEAIGTEEAVAKAEAYSDFYDKIRAEVEAKTADIPEDEKPVVFVCTEDDGISSHGKGSLVNEWVNLSGGKYVCEMLNIEGSEVTLTAEQIVSADPDIIICVTVAGRDAILANPAFSELKAVKNGKIFVNPLGGSVWFKGHFEAALQLSWAPTVISPDYAADIDTRAYVDEFYSTFYGYTVTDSDFELIMNPTVGSR